MKAGVFMKSVFTAILLCISISVYAQLKNDHAKFANFERFAEANRKLGAPAKNEKRVVLMGNSITEGWPRKRAVFFQDHPYLIGRGISGQTSYQFLARFRQDVIDLKPAVVVILGGTNDIAENTGAYDEERTMGNIKAMVEIARYNKIKVALGSCLPAEGFKWRPSITDAMVKIRHLNERIKAYAQANKIPYIDYFSAMVTPDGKALKPELASDHPGVHPNAEGYMVMEKLLMPVIEKLR